MRTSLAFGLAVCVDGVGCESQHVDFVSLRAGSLCVDGVGCESQNSLAFGLAVC